MVIVQLLVQQVCHSRAVTDHGIFQTIIKSDITMINKKTTSMLVLIAALLPNIAFSETWDEYLYNKENGNASKQQAKKKYYQDKYDYLNSYDKCMTSGRS